MNWLSPIALVVAATPLLLLAVFVRRRLLLVPALLLVVAGLALMTPIVANALVALLEREAEPAAGECDDLQAVVLLAGGLQRPAGHARDFAALTYGSLQRGFVYLERGHPGGLPLLVAGGGHHRVAEAEVLALLLGELQLAPAIMLETASRSTADNAVEVRRALPAVRRIGLATSALHMPRARRSFVEAGFEVCRMPLDRLHVAASGPWAFWPQSSALRKSEAALHELLGDLYYRWVRY